MYRISNDKRVQKSAQLICNGLIKCLETKKLNEITISDIQKISGVSRATIYRLFDSIPDILEYQFQQKIDSTINDLANSYKISPETFFIHFLNENKQNYYFFKALAENNRIDIIHSVLWHNADIITAKLINNQELTPLQTKYVTSLIASSFFSFLITLINEDELKSDSELYDIFKFSLKTVSDMFNNE